MRRKAVATLHVKSHGRWHVRSMPKCRFANSCPVRVVVETTKSISGQICLSRGKRCTSRLISPTLTACNQMQNACGHETETRPVNFSQKPEIGRLWTNKRHKAMGAYPKPANKYNAFKSQPIDELHFASRCVTAARLVYLFVHATVLVFFSAATGT